VPITIIWPAMRSLPKPPLARAMLHDLLGMTTRDIARTLFAIGSWDHDNAKTPR
jgi:hypothetical protein